jgi:cyclic nucleotide gated channel
VLITYFRFNADLFFFLHILMKFRTVFVAPSSRVFGR